MNYSQAEHENELESYRNQLLILRLENEELVSRLHAVNEKLGDSERLKGHFISNITNEIINPFASIMALADQIRHFGIGDISSAHHMAELIFDEAFHLDFQLLNIFAAAQIEAGKDDLKITVVTIHELGDHLQYYFKDQLLKKKIQLDIRVSSPPAMSTPLFFRSDREKLDLILKNLISNSIKFSFEDSTIGVDFFLENGILSIEVSDSGKGIRPEGRKVIFDRFMQLDEKINSINTGHGLGLSIVLAYVDMLEGKVTFSKTSGAGTCLIITIPASTQPDEWEDLEGFLLDSVTSY